MLLITPHVESNLQLKEEGYFSIVLIHTAFTLYKHILSPIPMDFLLKIACSIVQCRRYFTPPSTPLVFDKYT